MFQHENILLANESQPVSRSQLLICTASLSFLSQNKGVDEKDNSIIDMCLKLAVIYGSFNEHEKANFGFKYCIHAQEEKMKSNEEISDDTHALWAMSCDWYAQYLLNNARYREALMQFEQAFLISNQLFGETHPQTLVILNSLGTVCSRMGNDIEAVDYFNKAIAIGKDTASENLSTFLVNLGKVTVLNNRLDLLRILMGPSLVFWRKPKRNILETSSM